MSASCSITCDTEAQSVSPPASAFEMLPWCQVNSVVTEREARGPDVGAHGRLGGLERQRVNPEPSTLMTARSAHSDTPSTLALTGSVAPST